MGWESARQRFTASRLTPHIALDWTKALDQVLPEQGFQRSNLAAQSRVHVSFKAHPNVDALASLRLLAPIRILGLQRKLDVAS